jgi:hypothetical protein
VVKGEPSEDYTKNLTVLIEDLNVTLTGSESKFDNKISQRNAIYSNTTDYGML